MGMSHAGEIAALARIAHPDWGVITNVGSAHAQNFPDGVAGIARAKYELVQSLPAHGVAFLNCDDPYVGQFGRDFHGRSIYFGIGPCADPRAANIEELGAEGVRFQVTAGEEQATVTLALLGRHNIWNAMAAIAAGFEAGIPLARVRCCRWAAAPSGQARRGAAHRRSHSDQRLLQLQSGSAQVHDRDPCLHAGQAAHPGGRRDAGAGPRSSRSASAVRHGCCRKRHRPGRRSARQRSAPCSSRARGRRLGPLSRLAARKPASG